MAMAEEWFVLVRVPSPAGPVRIYWGADGWTANVYEAAGFVTSEAAEALAEEIDDETGAIGLDEVEIVTASALREEGAFPDFDWLAKRFKR